MKAISYTRLMDNEQHFVGFKRTITEFLPAGNGKWQLDPISHNKELSCKIDTPPNNIIGLKRVDIRKYTKFRKENENEMDTKLD